MLQEFREDLIQDHTVKSLAKLLFNIWRVQVDDQFNWFISCFEESFREKDPFNFEATINAFNDLVEIHE